MQNQRRPRPPGSRSTGVARVLGGKPVLDGVDLTIAEHERLGIVGRSGAGKSTLLSLVAGLDEPDRGVVSRARRDWRPRAGSSAARSCRSVTPCSPGGRRSTTPASRSRTRGWAAARPASRHGRSSSASASTGAEDLRPARLSAGMRQRVAFLRTLLARKDVLLLDEPFGALDAITRGELQEWLAAALAEEPQTVVLVTHDIEEALLLCDRVAVLSRGRIVDVLEVDVERDVADPAFVELRKLALEAIE